MFTYNLREDKKRDVAIYTMARSFRFLCLFFAIFLLIGFFSLLFESGWENRYIAPLVIVLVLLLSALYRDEWIMNNKERTFTYAFGLGPFLKKKTYSYDSIKRLEVTHFIKGLPDNTTEKPSFKHRAYVIFAIRMNDEESTVHQLEIMPEKKSGGKLERIANLLSAYTGLALYVDRSRDESYNIKSLF